MISFYSLAQQDDLFSSAPRTEDGRFTNDIGKLDKGSLGVRLPFFARRVGTSFARRDGAPELVQNDGSFLRDYGNHQTSTVTWIGHSTLLIQMDGATFLTDPIWSKYASPVSFAGPNRYSKPGLEIAELPNIDFVLISHNHYDHLDIPTLKKLVKQFPDLPIIAPLGHKKLFKKHKIDNLIEMDWGDSIDLNFVTIRCLPSQHWSKRSLSDTNKSLWASWSVTGSQKNFYFAGDTGYFDGFKKIGELLGPFDLAAIPIGAYSPRAMMKESHMNPEEALQAAIDLRASKTTAIHFGTFNLSDEPLAEPPERFIQAAKSSADYEPEQALVMKVGETIEF